MDGLLGKVQQEHMTRCVWGGESESEWVVFVAMVRNEWEQQAFEQKLISPAVKKKTVLFKIGAKKRQTIGWEESKDSKWLIMKQNNEEKVASKTREWTMTEKQ